MRERNNEGPITWERETGEQCAKSDRAGCLLGSRAPISPDPQGPSAPETPHALVPG